MNKRDYVKEEGKILFERIAKYLDRGFMINNFEHFVEEHKYEEIFMELLNIYGNFRPR